jgi:hypothetical protein
MTHTFLNLRFTRGPDAFSLSEAPDYVSMAAVALAITGGGKLSSLQTTVLLSVEQTMEAVRMAHKFSTDPRM